MADIVDIAKHLPDPEPGVVADFRLLSSEALNGRITSYVVVRVDDVGKLHASYFMASPVAEIALATLVDFEEIEKLID